MFRVGVDIGGTNIAVGLVHDSLQIVRKYSVPFPKTGVSDVVGDVSGAIRELLAQENVSPDQLSSLGVVVPGSISPGGTHVIHAYNLDFHNVPLQALLRQRFPDLPVLIANDADGAALAELYCGALRGFRSGILLTLGTGLGGGMILNGQLYNGGLHQGCELGHMLLADGGKPCTCGNRGCAEAYCSASALAEAGKEAALSHPESALASLSFIDAKAVVDCAKAGDETALAVFDRYLDSLSSFCASLFNLLDAEVLAIGGGLSGAGDFLFSRLEKKTDPKCFYSRHGAIVPAQLGNDAGILGAALLGLS